MKTQILTTGLSGLVGSRIRELLQADFEFTDLIFAPRELETTKQQKKLLPLSKKELFIAGIFLFWGEGSKQRGRIVITNTNPLIMQFAKYWMTKILKIPQKKLIVRLHLYKDMDTDENISYWSHILKLPKDQFKTPYIKSSNRKDLTYKSYGHGTCNIMCFNTALSEQIAMSIKCVAEQCGAKNNLFWYN